MTLDGQTAIITGGAKGIGFAIAARLHAAGMRLLLTGRDTAALEAASAQLGDGADSVACDLAEPAAIAELFVAARCRFSHLDLLVNNAGVGVFGPCTEVALADWDQVMAVNARGAFLCAQAAFRWMQEQAGGRIVNIGSVVSHKGYEHQVVYAASKHALLGLTKVMAREGQAHNIRVAAVCPGGVATEMVQQARPDLDPAELIQPDDVARAVEYLAAEPPSCVTDIIDLRRRASTPFA
jgi:3-oxoacyl-[acyl-carrier protein] reductase